MRERDTASLSFHCFGEYTCVVYSIDFVFTCGSGFLAEVVSYCSVTETFAIGFQNNWLDYEWTDFGVFLEYDLFLRFQMCLDIYWQEFLIYFSFWWYQIASIVVLWGMLFRSLNVPVHHRQGILLNRLMSLSDAMRRNFPMFSGLPF